MRIRVCWFIPFVAALFLFSPPMRGAVEDSPRDLKRIELTVDGVAREGLVFAPANAKTTATPVVFVFHGHGGSARNAARSFDLQKYWPEAIVVYLQGLKTPGQLTDPQGNRPGWQAQAGDQNDRDLRFFDAVLGQLKRDYSVDPKRIYATGHSNGGGFTYLLWSQRADVLAAVAPSAAAARYANTLKPKPAMVIGGENDPLVKFSWQQATIGAIRKINGCEPDGQPWNKLCTLYPSKIDAPVVTLIHSGGHEFNRDAPQLIAKFFKEQALK